MSYAQFRKVLFVLFICLYCSGTCSHSLLQSCLDPRCQTRLVQVSLSGLNRTYADHTVLSRLLTCTLYDQHNLRVLQSAIGESFDDHLLANTMVTKLRVRWPHHTKVNDIKSCVFKMAKSFIRRELRDGKNRGRVRGIKTGFEHEADPAVKICVCNDYEESVMKTVHCDMACTIREFPYNLLDTSSAHDSPCITLMASMHLSNNGQRLDTFECYGHVTIFVLSILFPLAVFDLHGENLIIRRLFR